VATAGATLRFSPRPVALLIRTLFARGGRRTRAILDRHAPVGVRVTGDERYGPGPDEVLDVYHPARGSGPAPVVVWVHGGGWVGGSKEEIAGYLRLLASRGFVAVGVRYTRAPGATYPMPVRQTMLALGHLTAHATRLGLDPHRIVLAGDSAGAQIAAQVAAVATNPAYATRVGVTPTVAGGALRGVVLCCGAFDPARFRDDSVLAAFLTAAMWAYSGTRDWRHDPNFASMAVADGLTAAFPPAFVTVGNRDPLLEHSEALIAALATAGVPTEALLFEPDHAPALGHEYQFDLDGTDARDALERIVAFVAMCTREAGRG
jgi:acetyl esterase/lipase